jgi:hypothetical protein
MQHPRPAQARLLERAVGPESAGTGEADSLAAKEAQEQWPLRNAQTPWPCTAPSAGSAARGARRPP